MATIVTKECTVCKKELPIEDFYEFNKKYKIKDGTIKTSKNRMSRCIPCHKLKNEKYKEQRKEYAKKWHINNLEYSRSKSSSWSSRYKQGWWDIASTIVELKCSICGYDKHSSALDFHHVLPEEKEMGIHTIMTNSSPMNKDNVNIFIEEIGKCIVLCSNCHREHHAKYNYLNNEGGS